MTEPRTELTELVLDVVGHVPAGRATTYALVAEAVRAATGRGHARYVGTVMQRYGAEVPWWRVVRADGTLPRPLRERALEHYALEGTPLDDFVAGRVNLTRALWDPVEDWSPPVGRPSGRDTDA